MPNVYRNGRKIRGTLFVNIEVKILTDYLLLLVERG